MTAEAIQTAGATNQAATGKPADGHLDAKQEAERRAASEKALHHQTDLADKSNHRVLQSAHKSSSGAALHHVEITGTNKAQKPAPSEQPSQLSEAALRQKAQLIHDALYNKSLGLFNNPEAQKILDELKTLNQADKAALEKTYQTMFRKSEPDFLRHELTSRLSDVQAKQALCLLDKSDNRTNDAGNLMVAMAMLKEDPSKGNTMLRDVLLNKSSLAQLDTDCRKQFNKSLKQILDGATNLDAATREALPYLTKSGGLTVDETMALAKIAVKHQNLELLNQALRGDDAKAVKAREELQKDANFRKSFGSAFTGDNSVQAHDILRDGRPSLATIADADTHHFLGIYDNKENLELALTHATDKERQLYLQGRALAGKKNVIGAEAEAVQFYNKLHGAFQRDGNAREATQWESELLYGKDNLISQLSQAHSNGWADGHVFGIGAGHSTNDLASIVEHMSASDWQRLHDPATGKAFRAEIDRSLETYADPKERQELLKLIDAKANAKSYDDAQKILRNLQQVVSDNQTGILGNPNKSQSAIVDSMLHLNQSDMQKYLHDAKFKADVDNMVKSQLTGPAQLLAQRTLDKLSKTGKQPEMDAVDRVLSDSVHDVPAQSALKDFEAALADKGLRARLNLPEDKMSDQDRQILCAIQGTFSETVMKAVWSSPEGAQKLADDYVNKLLKNGSLSLGEKLSLDVPHQDLIPAIAKASQAERTEAEKYLNRSEIELVEHAAGKGGNLDLIDQIRLSAIEKDADHSTVTEAIGHLTADQKAKLKNDYQARYHCDLDGDLLAAASSPADRTNAANDLSVDHSDGRQDYYDHLKQYLDNSGGFSPDGSEMTTQRALSLNAEALKEYQNQLKKLSPEKQKLMNEFFGAAFQQYKDSKDKLAEITIDATLTAAALAAAPFSGGLSLAEVGYIATASAAYRVAVMKACQGKGFDSSPENILKQCIIGGTSGGLNFLGPEAIAGCRALGRAVAARVSTDLVEGAVKQSLRADAAAVIKKELPALVRSGDQAGMDRLAASLLKPGATEDEAQAVRQSLRQSIAASKKAEQEALAARLANKSMLQAAAEGAAIGSGANIASDLVTAPFNKDGIDWDQLQRSALTGLAVGAIMPVVFHGAAAGLKAGKSVYLNVTRGADGAYIDPAINGEFAVTDASGKTKTYKPGSGEVYRPQHGDKIESGPEELSAPRDLRTRSGDGNDNPVEMDGPRDVIKINGRELRPNEQMTVGRLSSNDVVLSPLSVSRNHAVIGRDNEGRLYIQDVGSSFGTYVNGHKLDPKKFYYISERDRVQFGPQTHEQFSIVREVAPSQVGASINGQRLDLSHGELMVGRGKFGLNSQYVSADHLKVGRDDRGLYIVDRYSTNGTFVNGQKIRPNERVYLKPTDRVQLSSTSGPELKLDDAGDGGQTPRDGGQNPRDGRQPENQRGAERLEYPQQLNPSPESVAQSNHYAATHQESDRLKPGFQNAGGRNRFGADGQATDISRPSTIFDPAHDSVLREKMAEAHRLFDRYRNDPYRLAQELTKYSRDLLSPAGMSEASLDAWYNQFNDAHAGRKVLLGEFLAAGKGVCSQQAFLLKVLADDFGLQCTMVRGMQGRHAWTTMTIDGKTYIFDPRWKALGVDPRKMPQHTPGYN